MNVSIPVSVGELLDKISILQIKSQRIADPAKLHNVQTELIDLLAVYSKLVPQLSVSEISEYIRQLKDVNESLWEIEDFKRSCEKTQQFDQMFIEAARQVYLKNDVRAAIKKKINLACGSSIVEEKSYE